jgi:hypothetical protein
MLRKQELDKLNNAMKEQKELEPFFTFNKLVFEVFLIEAIEIIGRRVGQKNKPTTFLRFFML